MGLLRKAWAHWKAIAHLVGWAQSMILLSVIYHVAIGPIGLLARLGGRDLLGLRRGDGASFGVDAPPTSTTLEQAQKQF